MGGGGGEFVCICGSCGGLWWFLGCCSGFWVVVVVLGGCGGL